MDVNIAFAVSFLCQFIHPPFKSNLRSSMFWILKASDQEKGVFFNPIALKI